jgi:hypothetical protein
MGSYTFAICALNVAVEGEVWRGRAEGVHEQDLDIKAQGKVVPFVRLAALKAGVLLLLRLVRSLSASISE